MKPAITIGVVLALMGGGQFASSQEEAKLTKEQLLARFDSDGDGKLSRAERKAAVQARASAEKEDREQRQRDRNGELGEDELLRMFDENKNGKLDRAEKTRAKEFQRQRRLAMQQAFRPPVQQIIGAPRFLQPPVLPDREMPEVFRWRPPTVPGIPRLPWPIPPVPDGPLPGPTW